MPFDSTFSRDDDDGVNCWDGNVDEDWAVLSCTELFWAVLGCTELIKTKCLEEEKTKFGRHKMGPTNINDGDDVFDDIGGWTVIEMPIFQARLFYPWRLSFARYH